jgi:cyanophycinase
MITGNEFKHPVYTGDFPTIEANNIELKPGLGLLSDIIIDQHFVKRQRMNRLITVSLENPGKTCIGIDESTALLVRPGSAEVVGESQVILIRHREADTRIVNGLLGGRNMELSVYLPGDTLKL